MESTSQPTVTVLDVTEPGGLTAAGPAGFTEWTELTDEDRLTFERLQAATDRRMAEMLGADPVLVNLDSVPCFPELATA